MGNENTAATILLREQLRSEKKRAFIILGILGALGIVGMVAINFAGNLLTEVTGNARTIRVIVIALGVFLTFQGGLGFYFHRAEKKVTVPPRYVFIGSTIIESLAPTALIFALSGFIPGGQAVDAPPLLIYFLLIILSTLRLDPKLSILTGLVCGLGYLAVALMNLEAAAAYADHHLSAFIVPNLARSIMMIASGGLAAFVSREILTRQRLAQELRDERQRVVDVFGQHVSPAVVDKVLAQDAELASEMRYVCVMFLDIRNFTTFSETRTPDEVVDFLNHLFEPLVDIVGRHNGVINKFLGDGFMAVFGAPVSDGRDSENAVRASMEMIDIVETLRADGSIPDIDIGIGLHAGEATTGTVGSRQRKEYTVIGDTVNLASRIEGLNKQFEARLLVSNEIWSKVGERFPNLEGETMAPVQVKGRAEPVVTHRLVPARNGMAPPTE